jgi:hypothetical protein
MRDQLQLTDETQVEKGAELFVKWFHRGLLFARL